jgi:hypothetical protein
MEHAPSEQVKLCPTIHASLEQFETCDLPFRLTDVFASLGIIGTKVKLHHGRIALPIMAAAFAWRKRACLSVFLLSVREKCAMRRSAQRGEVSVLRAQKRVRSFHFYYITSCLLTHCLFGRFFLAFFPLYSGGSDARLAPLR